MLYHHTVGLQISSYHIQFDLFLVFSIHITPIISSVTPSHFKKINFIESFKKKVKTNTKYKKRKKEKDKDAKRKDKSFKLLLQQIQVCLKMIVTKNNPGNVPGPDGLSSLYYKCFED